MVCTGSTLSIFLCCAVQYCHQMSVRLTVLNYLVGQVIVTISLVTLCMPIATAIFKFINFRIIIRLSNVIRTSNIEVLNPLDKILQVRYLAVQTGVFRIVSIDLFTDAAAILNSIISNIYYGMLNLPPEHPIITIWNTAFCPLGELTREKNPILLAILLFNYTLHFCV